MPTHDVMMTRCCQVDDQMAAVRKRPDAKRSPREVVTLARLCAITGVGSRAYYRGLRRDSQAWFPPVPERTRVFRLCKTHMAWTAPLLAAPTGLGIADRSGRACSPPMREGRRPPPIGHKGPSHHRWMGGGQRCVVLHQGGLVWAWACAPAKVHDAPVHPLLTQGGETLMVLTDPGVHATTGEPVHMHVGQRGSWKGRMLVETLCALLTTVVHGQQVRPRVWG